MFPNNRIAAKLVAEFLIISVAPLMIIAVLAQTSAEKSLRRQIERQLRTTADNKANQIYEYFQERVEDAMTLANTPSILSALERLNTPTAPRTRETPSDEASPGRSSDESIQKFLASYAETAGYGNLYLMSSEGTIYLSAKRIAAAPANEPARASREVSQVLSRDSASEWRRVANRAATLLEPALSDVVVDPQTNEPAVYLATPAVRDGAVLGIVAIQVGQDDLNDVIQDYIGLGTTGEVVVAARIDSSPLVVAPLRHDPDAAYRRRIDLEVAAMHDAVRGRHGYGEVADYRNEPVLAVWQYIPSFRWGMVVKIDRQEALAPLLRLRYQSIAVGLVAALIVIAVAFIISRSIAEPISQLTSSVTRVAAGHFDERADIETHDEIGDLANEFNHMAQRLQDNIEQISTGEIRTQAILDSTADGIITIAEDGTIQSCNQAAARLFQRDSSEIISLDVDEVSHELKALVRSDNSGGEVEFEIAAPTGERVSLALRLTRMNSQGEQLVIATLQDITQRKNAERQRERLLAGIREAVGRLSTASSELLASSAKQSENAQDQAALVSQTSTTATEMTQTTHHTSERAQEVASSASRAQEVSQSGRGAVQEALGAMDDVCGQSQATAMSILSLAERSQAISAIVTTVHEIAEQTNVLALNAAVEASRAGEHGSGFAVVASEVKSLAGRSKEATQQIRQILREVQQATQAAIESTESGQQLIEAAATIVNRADNTISSLAETISEAATNAVNIVTSSGQQTDAMDLLSQSMQQADASAQHALAATRQAEQLARDLNQLGNQLQALVREAD